VLTDYKVWPMRTLRRLPLIYHKIILLAYLYFKQEVVDVV